MKIQDIPNPDSPNNEAFEAIVELYFQIEGYITSSGKWFWVWEDGKKQRGYQDIDVLAINATEVVIVSVTSNLDDKLRQDRDGNIRNDMLEKLKSYFSRVEEYFQSVRQYQWLASTNRKKRKVVVYINGFRKTKDKVKQALNDNDIEFLSADEILITLIKYVKHKNIKIQDQMLRTIQILVGLTQAVHNHAP